MAGRSTAFSKTRDLLSAAASLAASVVVVHTVINHVLPREVRDLYTSTISRLFGDLSSELTVVVEEFEGFAVNELYEAARAYLGGRIASATRKVRACKRADERDVVVAFEPGEEIVDVFEGMLFKWKLVCGEQQNRSPPSDDTPIQIRSFELSFHRKHADAALGSYLPHVMNPSKAMRLDEGRAIKLHMFRHGSWKAVDLHHLVTFDKLAIDSKLKRRLMADLKQFVDSRDQYDQVGKVWKRGYLVYGAPGSGKSSLIAAMANFLKFDVYYLDLAVVRDDATLRALLSSTPSRSMLVIENIDSVTDLRNREAQGSPDHDEKVTLSGLLDVADGLWSSCGAERIIVFTERHNDDLDPALLRPGRVDMHVPLSYCSPSGFRTLASAAHGVDEHPLFRVVEGLIREVEVTPAEVSGELMRSGDVEAALRGLVRFLHEKKASVASGRPRERRVPMLQGRRVPVLSTRRVKRMEKIGQEKH